MLKGPTAVQILSWPHQGLNHRPCGSKSLSLTATLRAARYTIPSRDRLCSIHTIGGFPLFSDTYPLGSRALAILLELNGTPADSSSSRSLAVAISPLYQLYYNTDKTQGTCDQQAYWHQRQISHSADIVTEICLSHQKRCSAPFLLIAVVKCICIFAYHVSSLRCWLPSLRPAGPYLLDLAQQFRVHAVAFLRPHRPEVVLHPDLRHELVQPTLRAQERAAVSAPLPSHRTQDRGTAANGKRVLPIVTSLGVCLSSRV